MARKFELEDKNKLESQIKVRRSSLPINVLLIEDNPGDVRIIQEVFLSAKDVTFNLECADRLSLGLQLLGEKKYDLLLLDLVLPDSYGFETYERVQAWALEIPVIILTALGDESLATKALRAGAEDYLIKDKIDNDILMRSARYSIERKRAEMALRKANDELEMKVQERTKELVRANEALRAEITERKQAEKALQETKERFASFMQHLPGAAWIKDIQGRYVYANKVAERIFNTTLSGLLGKTDEEIFPADTASQFRGNDRYVIESGRNLQTIETLLQDDGIFHHSVVSKFPIFDRDGILTMVGGVAIDITEWKRAEEKLALYQEIFDKSPDGIAIIDPKGYYLEQNRAHHSLVGYGDEELDGKTPAIHLGEEVFSKIGQELTETGRYRGEVISHTKMGTSVPIELSAFTVRDEKGETVCYVGIKRDITERRQAEEELSKFKFISDNSNDAHFFLDRDGRLLYVNKVACEKLGYSEDELLKMSVPDIDPDFNRAKLQNLFQLLQKEKVSPFESVHRRKDGSAFPVEISATGVEFNGMHYIFAVSRDITMRKKRQEALQESESQLRLALEAGRMGIWDWNMLTDEVMWSSNLEPIHGLAPSTFGGTYEDFLKIIHPEDYESVTRAITRSIETGGDYHVEFRNVRPDGSIHWMFAKGQVFYDETGNAVRMVGVATDITERKQAEGQIRESLREKEVLLKEIHHRVKNNLQIVSSLLNLQSRNITGKKVREKFKESQNRVKSMALIHEKLYQSENLEGIYFQEYIHSLLKYLFSSYGVDTNQIKLKINSHKMLLSLDKAIPCGLIVNEIVSNSLKYAFPGGVQGEVYIDFRTNEDNYLLTVGNNGIPFPENLDFTKTKSLGLQLVCALVEQLRGTIELDRTSGTEFRIAFSP